MRAHSRPSEEGSASENILSLDAFNDDDILIAMYGQPSPYEKRDASVERSISIRSIRLPSFHTCGE